MNLNLILNHGDANNNDKGHLGASSSRGSGAATWMLQALSDPRITWNQVPVGKIEPASTTRTKYSKAEAEGAPSGHYPSSLLTCTCTAHIPPTEGIFGV